LSEKRGQHLIREYSNALVAVKRKEIDPWDENNELHLTASVLNHARQDHRATGRLSKDKFLSHFIRVKDRRRPCFSRVGKTHNNVNDVKQCMQFYNIINLRAHINITASSSVQHAIFFVELLLTIHFAGQTFYVKIQNMQK